MKLRFKPVLLLTTSVATFAALAVGSFVAVPNKVAATGPGPAARVIELTNVERQKVGLAPVVANPTLANSAQTYSQVLATGECWAHDCGPTPELSDRVVNAGYTNYSKLGENLAGGQKTPEEVVAAWMASPEHRAVILNPDYTQLGVGIVTGGARGIYWTEHFGA